MLAAIWHASFHVADLERSVAFYRDVLGMELVHEQEQANEYTRALVGYPDATCGSRSSLCPVAGTGEHARPRAGRVRQSAAPGRPGPSPPGAGHLAFAVPEHRREYGRLSAGVRFVSPPNHITAGSTGGGRPATSSNPTTSP
jgi:catechol 2,3-dioxygenase-like lactoylglutathione lyase family enzyme